MNEVEILKRYLHREKMCITYERLEMVRTLADLEETFTADELCEKLGERGVKIVNSTVYRNLKILCSAGLLEMVKTSGDGKSKFVKVSQERVVCHLTCRRGNKARAIQNSELEELIINICRENGFEDYGIVVRIEGIRKRGIFETNKGGMEIAEKLKNILTK